MSLAARNRRDRRDRASGAYAYTPLGEIRSAGVFNVAVVVLATSHPPPPPPETGNGKGKGKRGKGRGKDAAEAAAATEEAFNTTRTGDFFVTLQLVDPTTWAADPEMREELLAVQLSAPSVSSPAPSGKDEKEEKGAKTTKQSTESSPAVRRGKRGRTASDKAEIAAAGEDSSKKARTQPEAAESAVGAAEHDGLTVGDALVVNFFSEDVDGLPGTNEHPGALNQGDVMRIHRLRVDRWCDDDGVFKVCGFFVLLMMVSVSPPLNKLLMSFLRDLFFACSVRFAAIS
jgi:hypothetical protein